VNPRRLAAQAWPLLQVALAVTLAWLMANLLHGQENPFFAPIAAAVALSAPRGERGLQAVRLLMGVLVGIATGEVIGASMGVGYGGLAIATFVAMALATGIGGARTVITQAASSAILTTIAAAGEAGVHRLADALIGGGVALIFSQVVFSPEPVALLRRAETDALSRIARGLELTADALGREDERLGDQAVEKLRALRDPLGELARLRTVSKRVARHSAVWRSQVDAVVREQEHADHLDLVASGSVMLARMAVEAKPPGRALLATRIRELSTVIAALAEAPGDRSTRQRAAHQALEAGRPVEADAAPDQTSVVTVAVLRIVARDVMVFAGLTIDQAEAAMRAGEAEADVPAPPATPRVPFGFDQRRRERPLSSELPRRESDTPDGHPKE